MSNFDPPPKDLHLARSTLVWHDDGTVVIQAGHTLFRVYRGVLQRHSTVFKDLFALPQPEDAPKYEDVPLLELHDSAEDMGLLLLMLHELKWCFSPSDTTGALSFEEFAVIARLSEKYNIEALQEWAAARLTVIYSPSSSAEWLLERVTFKFGRTTSTSREASWSPTFGDSGVSLVEDLDRRNLQPGDHIIAVNLARHLNLPEILPVAFYAAATSLSFQQILLNLEDITNDASPHDDQPATPPNLESDPLDVFTEEYSASVHSDSSSRPVCSPARELVLFDDRHDAKICAEGKLRLAMLFNPWLHISVHLSAAPNQLSCKNRFFNIPGPGCTEKLKRTLASDRNCMPDGSGYFTKQRSVSLPDIRSLKQACDAVGFCENCRPSVTTACEDYQKLVWADLRSIFQLMPCQQ